MLNCVTDSIGGSFDIVNRPLDPEVDGKITEGAVPVYMLIIFIRDHLCTFLFSAEYLCGADEWKVADFVSFCLQYGTMDMHTSRIVWHPL